MKKNETVVTTTEQPINATPEYDGVETWFERVDLTNPPVQKTAKINMSTSEVKKFLGDADPNLYFRGGKIPTWYKEFGTLVDEEDEELKILRNAAPEMPELLLFKHKTQPLYNVLVPKPLGEHELDGNGDITDPVFHADMRAIAFGGSNAPKSFEKTFFRMRLNVIVGNLKKGLDRMKEWRAHKAL